MHEARLSAQQQAKIRRLSAPQQGSPDADGGEINVVPYLDMILNIMMFVLATVSVTFVSTAEAKPPPRETGIRPPLALSLTLLLTSDGISLKTADGNIAPGCDAVGPGVTIPAKGRGADGDPVYDYAALSACATKLKGLSKGASGESQVRIAASNGISYRRVIDCIDSVRVGPSGEPLFPEVLFAVPR
jgi:biopolymer transport protein ExbD